jgi:hypothetical protein
MLRYLRKNCFKHCTSERKDGFVNYLPFIPSFTILSLSRSRNVHTFVSYSQNLHELHKPKHRIKLHKQKHKIHLAQLRRQHPTFRCTFSTSIIRSDGPNTAGCLFPLVVSTIYYMSLLYQYPMLTIEQRKIELLQSIRVYLTKQRVCIQDIHIQSAYLEHCCSLPSSHESPGIGSESAIDGSICGISVPFFALLSSR